MDDNKSTDFKYLLIGYLGGCINSANSSPASFSPQIKNRLSRCAADTGSMDTLDNAPAPLPAAFKGQPITA